MIPLAIIATLLSPLARAAGPTFSVERGLYDASFSVEITPGASDSTLWCARNSDTLATPCPTWTVSTTTALTATEILADGTALAPVTHTYIFVDDVVTSDVMDANIAEDATYGPALDATLRDLPSIALWSDGGVSTTEAEVSFEWIDPDGDSQGVRCGAARVGGHSIGYDKTNIRLYFRGEYGTPRYTADLYADFATGVPPTDSFDALNLRGGSHDSVFYLGSRGQYLRNRWMDETQLELGHLVPHGRYAHAYLDGEYIGLYHVRERFNAAFMADYLGGDEDDYEAVNGGRVVDGDGNAWAQVVALSGDHDAVSAWLDVENFVDYMILNFYAANDWDWLATQNWMAAGATEPGGAGYVFHSSDSDICLYYAPTHDVLDLGGPEGVWTALMSEAHPDFLVLVADRLAALLTNGGMLTEDAAIARYLRLAALIEDAVVAESARWGGGWWDRDGEWLTERDYLVDSWFPVRTGALLSQVRAAGWLPLDAPVVDPEPGEVAAGTSVQVSAPDGSAGELWLCVGGEDPRQPGGDLSDCAQGPDTPHELVLAHGTEVRARMREGEVWGPIVTARFTVDEAPALVLNEWNAVDAEDLLDDDGEDAAWGARAGNGGDWIELVVVQDHLDLRGWRLTMEDRAGDAGTIAFLDAPVLADLRSGTLITVAAELPEDTAYDPEAGDWRFHLRAGEDGPGTTVSATAFRVSHREWQLTAWDADGNLRFGAVGEGVSPTDGISSGEVGLLMDDPDAATRSDDGAYGDGTTSTFGAANVWEDGNQDLSKLRAVVDGGGVHEDTGTTEPADDTGSPDTAGGDGDTADTGPTGSAPADDCGCSHGPGGVAFGMLGVLIALGRRRRLVVVGALGCSGPTALPTDDSAGDSDGATHDTAPSGDSVAGTGETGADTGCEATAEVCDGLDNDCDGAVDGDDPDLVDGLPFYLDADGDGHGGETLVTACALDDGLALTSDDCDDDDPLVHPDAEEACDGVDRDCDGQTGTAAGSSAACAAETCLDVLDAEPTATDGAYWLALPSGTAAPVWCDMTTDGGGWTLGFLRNTVSTGSQGDFGADEVDLDGLATSPSDASAASTATLASLDLNAFPWDTLHIAAYQSGTETFRSMDIAHDALRIDFGEDGYLLYGGESPYYWCGGDASYTDSGVGAVDNPAGAPSDCRGHGSLGSGWDFSESTGANQGLTLCGGDGSSFLSATWGGSWTYYGASGGAQALWVR